jgi:hypothetical protein
MLQGQEINLVQFRRNRDAFPEDLLRPYWGKRVAWNAEGTQIVASGATEDEVFDRLEELGIDPCQTVGEFIFDPNTSYIL